MLKRTVFSCFFSVCFLFFFSVSLRSLDRHDSFLLSAPVQELVSGDERKGSAALTITGNLEANLYLHCKI